MLGGEISIPTPQSNSTIRKTILSKIVSGEYKLGNIIAPRQYKKSIITSEEPSVYLAATFPSLISGTKYYEIMKRRDL